jgi:hypothetical protein
MQLNWKWYKNNELILLIRWLELNYEIANGGKYKKLNNFDKDLKDG